MCTKPNFAYLLPKRIHDFEEKFPKSKHKLQFINWGKTGPVTGSKVLASGQIIKTRKNYDPTVNMTMAERIDFLRHEYNKHLHLHEEGTRVIELKCGTCEDCRLQYASQWARRLTDELATFPNAMFITLTYDDAHLPDNNTLVPHDLRLFMKRLRKKHKGVKAVVMPNGNLESPIRYYMAGEYGSKSLRAHYHIILFNFEFIDKQPDEHTPVGKLGHEIWQSPTLTKLWGKGKANFGSVTPESCNYVARYAMKKVTSTMDPDYYKRYRVVETIDPETGELLFQNEEYEVHPEFSAMTTQPGIGYFFYQKYQSDIITNDLYNLRALPGNPLAAVTPRYYHKQLAKKDDELHDKVKAALADRALKADAAQPLEKTGDRRAVKLVCRKRKTESLQRNL